VRYTYLKLEVAIFPTCYLHEVAIFPTCYLNEVAIFPTCYLHTSDYHQYNISGMSVAESVGVVVKHSQLTNLELKISCMVLVDYKL